jgi:hypothetical protein
MECTDRAELQLSGVRWRELVIKGTDGRTVLDRPKVIVGWSDNGERGRNKE